jgi:type II secretory pathway pseudopilin PulG
MERVTDHGGESPDSLDRGETYIEILISLIIFGLISVALLGALMTSISSSSEHRYLSVDDTLVKSALETVAQNVQQQPSSSSAYVDCSASNHPNAIVTQWMARFSLPTPPVNYRLVVSGLECWNPSLNSGVGGFDPNCQYVNLVSTPGGCGINDAAGLQRVTVTVTDPSGYALSLSTLVRNSSFQGNYDTVY